MGGFPDADEDLLCEVFSIIGAAHHFGDRADDRGLVFFDEELECLEVAFFGAKHERDVLGVIVVGIRRRRGGWVCRLFLRGHLGIEGGGEGS